MIKSTFFSSSLQQETIIGFSEIGKHFSKSDSLILSLLIAPLKTSDDFLYKISTSVFTWLDNTNTFSAFLTDQYFTHEIIHL